MKRLSCMLACLAFAALPISARAEHARIDLQLIPVNADGGEGDAVVAHADTDPPAGGFNDRPLAKVQAGQPLVLQFVLTNTYPHGVLKNASVRYYVAREEKARQKSPPDLKDPVTEGRVTMNFKPECRVGARIAFKITEPGVYLLRVETQNTDSDHEHFSAIDVQVDK